MNEQERILFLEAVVDAQNEIIGNYARLVHKLTFSGEVIDQKLQAFLKDAA